MHIEGKIKKIRKKNEDKKSLCEKERLRMLLVKRQ